MYISIRGEKHEDVDVGEVMLIKPFFKMSIHSVLMPSYSIYYLLKKFGFDI